MSHIHFEFPDVKLLKKIRINFIGKESMKIETILIPQMDIEACYTEHFLPRDSSRIFQRHNQPAAPS